jgi:hypothetical protein
MSTDKQDGNKLENYAKIQDHHPLDWLKTKIKKDSDVFDEDPKPEYEPDPNVIGVMKYLNYGNTPAQNCKGDLMDKMWKIQLIDKLP